MEKEEQSTTEYQTTPQEDQTVTTGGTVDTPQTDGTEPAPDNVTDNAEIVDGAEQEESSVEPEKTEKKTSPKKKRVMRILRNVFLVTVIALGIWALFGIVNEIDPDSGAPFGEVIRGASPLFCVVLILVVLLAMVLDTLKFCIISKAVTGKFHVGMSTKTNFLGKYYDAVTPFATGGQPMQIYYLTTKGISGGNSSAMVLMKYIFTMLCWILLGGIFMTVGTAKGVLNGVSGGNLLLIAGWVGIAVNLIVPIFVLLFLILPKFMMKITLGIVKLGYKMKIVKDIEKTTARATKVVNDYKNSFKLMAKSPVKFVLLILTCFGESAITFAIPYFVMKAFNCPVDGMALTVISLNVFAVFGVSFIPTPGNAGVMESMGALAFSVAAGPALIWSVLTWRFAGFYIYIIIGLIMTVCDIIRKNVRDRKAKKQQAVEIETAQSDAATETDETVVSNETENTDE